MSIEPSLLVIAEHLGKKLVDKLIAGSLKATPTLSEKVSDALARHLTKVANWSANIQFFRMAAPKRVDEETISLRFSSIPRKFQAAREHGMVFEEDYFLQDNSSFVILGQPGTGKTTTLKRLARRVLFEEPDRYNDSVQVPILLRLNAFNRDAEVLNPVLASIATELGLHHKVVTRTDEDASNSGSKRTTSFRECEGSPIRDILPSLLDALSPLILLDGLDEVNQDARRSVEEDIAYLLESTQSSKFILTCRSGEYTNPIGYMVVVEVCDLLPSEIEEISRRWLGPDAGSRFIGRLSDLPLIDLARRPLFLTQMLAIYANSGYLPEQPFEIYRLIILLMIREWDRERDLVRMSRYANFEAERKLDFLAELAYQLVFDFGTRTFTSRDLGDAYDRIREKFYLPKGQEAQVVAEIESHTGIIAEYGTGRYEFSHLTILEYLCAWHIVRFPRPRRAIARYMTQYPAVVAVATVLSSHPAAWLAAVLCDPPATVNVSAQNIAVFLDRLAVESPNLAAGLELGFSLVGLVFRVSILPSEERIELLRRVDRLLSRPGLVTAFVNALCNYRIDPRPSSFLPGTIPLKVGAEFADGFLLDMEQPPLEGAIDLEWLRRRFNSSLRWEGVPTITRI